MKLAPTFDTFWAVVSAAVRSRGSAKLRAYLAEHESIVRQLARGAFNEAFPSPDLVQPGEHDPGGLVEPEDVYGIGEGHDAAPWGGEPPAPMPAASGAASLDEIEDEVLRKAIGLWHDIGAMDQKIEEYGYKGQRSKQDAAHEASRALHRELDELPKGAQVLAGGWPVRRLGPGMFGDPPAGSHRLVERAWEAIKPLRKRQLERQHAPGRREPASYTAPIEAVEAVRAILPPAAPVERVAEDLWAAVAHRKAEDLDWSPTLLHSRLDRHQAAGSARIPTGAFVYDGRCTLYTDGGFLGISRSVLTSFKAEVTAYAQYPAALRLRFRRLRKRSDEGVVLSYDPWAFLVEGEGPNPDDPVVPGDSSSPGVSVRQGRYASNDPRWRTDFEELLARSGAKVLWTAKGWNSHRTEPQQFRSAATTTSLAPGALHDPFR